MQKVMKGISSAFLDYYSELLRTSMSIGRIYAHHTIVRRGPRVSIEERHILDNGCTIVEIKEALWLIDRE